MTSQKSLAKSNNRWELIKNNFRIGPQKILIVQTILLALVFFATVPAVFGGTLGRARFSWDAVNDPIVTGYKVHWGTESGVYTQTFDAGNAIEATIAEFAEGVRYFSAITAYSNTGEESDYSTEISFTYDPTDRVILLEAENGLLTAPMQVFSDTSTSWVAASSANPNAAVTLNFNAPYSSNFYVWCRVLAPSASADSLYLTVDQGSEQAFDVYGGASPPAQAFQPGWIWSRVQVSPGVARAYALGAGSHSIRIRCSDNAALDRVVIVSTPDFTPTDALPRSGDFVAVAGQPQCGDVTANGTVTLTATLVATGPLNLQWYHNGVAIPGANLSSLSLSNLQASDGGAYTLSASTNSATSTTTPAIVSVPPASGTATPLITTNPSATDIVYGQTLASSILTGGAASVPGSFAFTKPTTVPVAGTASQSVTFTPTDTLKYGIVSTSVSVTVSKAMPLITSSPTAAGIVYGQPLSSTTLSGGSASVPGSFALIAPPTAPSGGPSGRARFSWDAVNDPIVSGYKVHWGTQSGVYTQTFDAGNATEATISGFAEGVRYFSAITAYSNTGEESDYSTEISFTYDPTDRIILLEAESGVLTAPMRVSSDASTSWVAASSADPNAAVTLNFEAPYSSNFYVWCRVLAPSASADSLYVTMDQNAEQVFNVYGDPSPPTQTFQSAWTWSRIQVSSGTPRAYALGAGSHSIRFRYLENAALDRVVIVSNPDFTPTDALPRSGDFVAVVGQPQGGNVTANGTVTLTPALVATGPLSLQWFHDGVAVPGATLSSLSLSNVQVSDGGAYTLSASRNSATAGTSPATLTVLPQGGAAPSLLTTIPAAGTASLSVMFTPADTLNYQIVTTSVSVTVSKATPLITTLPTATTISYGQTLASSTLSGGVASVPGSFAFTTPTTVPTAGTASQSVTFTPTDTLNYQIVTTSANVTVSKATPSITTNPSAASIVYGQTLSSSALSGGVASVAGSFSFTSPATTPVAGTASQSVTFTPTDTLNYGIVTTSVNVTVAKATPSITTKPTATAIVVGQTLASSTLSGGVASVPGSFAFTTPTKAPTAGTASQSVTFTPTDTSNYQTATTTVSVTVNAKVTLGNLAATYDGTAKSASVTTNPTGITVKLTYNGSSTAPKIAGSYAVLATVSDTKYTGSATGTLVIAKATTSITKKPTAKAIVYGQTLASSTLSNGTASVAGSFAFTTPTVVPAAGTASPSVTFTPSDTNNYQTAATTVSVTVSKATPLITTKPTAKDIVVGQTLASSTLSGGVASVAGSFAFTRPTTVPALGTSSQGVTFTPSDSNNYLTATTTANVTVKTAAATLSTTPESLANWRARCFTPGQIAAGQAADDADPDQDGLNNLAEYALGTNPLAFTTPLAAVVNSDGLVLTFDRPTGLPDVLYAAESSDDMILWNPCALQVVTDGAIQTMQAVDPLTSGDPSRRFIRLRFTKP